MAYEFQENRQIRIFISSTFRDMMKERDYLITRVFPELRRYCEERDISLFELDLRWGVTQEESENQMAFKICLNEVDNTRPFFIGLLGERYGWVPDEKTIEQMKPTNVFEEYKWLMDELKKKRSITEVEMDEGAFLPQDEINAYFYIRSPKMHTPDEHREEKDSHGEKMLLELKERIRNDSRYDANEYESLEQLGHQVEEDFKELVDKLFPGQGHLSYFEKERLQHYIYLKSKTRAYVSNPQWMKYLDDFADSGKKEAAIAGESGMGQSALLANWIVKRQEKQINNEKILYHFIGISQSEGDYYLITQRLIDEVRSVYNLPLKQESLQETNKVKSNKKDEDDDEEDIQSELQNLLLAIPKNQKLIIVIDSLDRLDDEEDVYLLNWIPEHPSNIKFIFSSTTGDKTIESLTRRTGAIFEIGSLPAQTRKDLVIKYFEKYSKKLSAAQMEKIISGKKSENPAILTAILDNLRIFGNFDILDRQIEERLSLSNEKLFDLFLQNIESLFKNQDMVKDILSLLAVSRHGLTETEIVNISKIPKLYWSQLSNCMSVHLITINGTVTFSSGIMLKAIKERYLKDDAVIQQYRKVICAYMKTEKEVSLSRKCDELPFQYMELKEWDELYDFLVGYEVFDHIYLKNALELGKYWRALRAQDKERYTLENYLKVNLKDKEKLIEFYNDLCSFIRNTLFDGSSGLIFAQKYLDACKDVSYDTDSANNDKGNYKLGYAYNAIGNCYNEMNEFDEAIENYIKALDIFKEISEKDRFHEATAYNNIAHCCYKMRRYFRAIKYFKYALKIIEKKFGKKEFITAELYRNIGECYSYIFLTGVASNYCKKSVKITEKIYGKEHPKTARAYYTAADVGWKGRKFKKSIKLFDLFRTIWINSYGEDNAKIARSYNCSSACYMYLRDYKTAIEYSDKSIVIFEKIYGEGCKESGSSLFTLGMCYNSLGDSAKAIEYFEKYLVPGIEDQSRVGITKFIIANCCLDLDEKNKALDCLNEALPIFKEKYGERRPIVGHAYLCIAMCYEKMGEKENAVKYYKEALPILRFHILFKKMIKTMLQIKYKNETSIIRKAIKRLSK